MNLEANKETIRKHVKTILKAIFAISVILILGYAIKKYFFSGKVSIPSQTGGLASTTGTLSTLPSGSIGAPVSAMGTNMGAGGGGIVENIQLKQPNSETVNNMLKLFK